MQAIAEGDEGAREVYADWLEESGDAQRAEYLRLQAELIATAGARGWRAEERFDQLARDLALLASTIDPAWRATVEGSVFESWLLHRDLRWLRVMLARSRPERPFELPEQLRYLEKLPQPGAPLVMLPQR